MEHMQRRSRVYSIGVALLLFACFTLGAHAGAPGCVAPPADQLSWWPGDGNMLDIAGSRDGTVQNGATFAPSMVGQAIDLDGVDDLVDIRTTVLGSAGPFTVDAWIYTNDIGTYQSIISEIGSEDTVGQFQFRIDVSGVLQFFRRSSQGSGVTLLTTNDPITPAAWTHVAAVFDGSDLKVYINGAEASGQLLPSNYSTTYPGTTKIGGADPVSAGQPGGYFFNGRIDELSVYNRALAASEIEAIFNAGSEGKCKPATNTPPNVDAGGPYSATEGGSLVVTATGSDLDGDTLTFAWDLDNDGSFETPGQSVTFSAAGLTALSSQTIAVQATDSGGLSAIDVAMVNITYPFTGFLQPVDNLPTLNSVNAGRAIPVKFSLSGNRGLAIFATDYPKTLAISCDATTPIDDIEETVSAGASSLSYDTSTDLYTYIWKTHKGWASTCRQLVVKLNDDTYYRANFKFQ
jgi:hypothetical protein